MKRLLELGAIFDDPSVNRGVIHLHPPFLHEFFDMARAQRVRHIPADPHQNNRKRSQGCILCNTRMTPRDVSLRRWYSLEVLPWPSVAFSTGHRLASPL